MHLQGKPGALGQVVAVLKAVYQLEHVYVWHGLSAYWSGLSHEEDGVAQYHPRLVFADPTPGLQVQTSPQLLVSSQTGARQVCFRVHQVEPQA